MHNILGKLVLDHLHKTSRLFLTLEDRTFWSLLQNALCLFVALFIPSTDKSYLAPIRKQRLLLPLVYAP
ncbi:hypothetical protein PIB30_042479 [Stylosanthes scabra]|uniref:Uncharacterized protein n=1 Tax=Stylosanthes scabra TaxID=79078 RepID=A0ABU6XEF7_9FABA|nr:hypothetical protein [Stylosanthes scabra]